MSRFIVHESGVIFDASECVLVDTDQLDDHDLERLSGDEYFDDGIISELAERCGVPIISANVGGFVHDGNDWSHCGRVVFSGDLWAECVKCGAVMSWDDDEVTA